MHRSRQTCSRLALAEVAAGLRRILDAIAAANCQPGGNQQAGGAMAAVEALSRLVYERETTLFGDGLSETALS